MPDKERFMGELFRVATPGGRVLVVTWCHRELRPGETALSDAELRLLAKINKGDTNTAQYRVSLVLQLATACIA